MSVTESFGGPCPRCGFDVCYVRFGSGTYTRYVACPKCLFAYGEYHDRYEHSKCKITGTTIFKQLLELPPLNANSIADLRDYALEKGRFEDHAVFEFDYEEDALMMEACVADPYLLEALGYEVDMNEIYMPEHRAPSKRTAY